MLHCKTCFYFLLVENLIGTLKLRYCPFFRFALLHCACPTIILFCLISYHHVISSYYIDMSFLPKNRQLVFSIPNYIRDTSEIFSISLLMTISLTSSFVFSSIFFYFRNTHIYVIKKNTRWFEDMKFIFSWKKVCTRSLRSLVKYLSTRR